ncbi:MAG: MmgE/PrpD family protein [Deltaproteobacteria bacterium]|nr:MAG: MmgE/PrpD family protein [Deltaproteobacteria bacterium]
MRCNFRIKESALEQALVLAQFLAQTDFNDLPHSALQAGKRGLLDCLGTAIGGANSQAAEMALNLIDEAGGALQATLLARGKRTSLRDAVLFNATAAHALDYDDTLSAPAAMVALAVAEQRSLPGRELLRSYVLGFEVASRMTRAIGGWENARGWHMMGVAGVFGAATAASLLLKLNPPQIIAALGVAATQSSGLMAMHGFLAKPFHSGKAAANGVFAAQLALRGCTTGPALEGSLSVSHAMGGTPTPDLAQKLGESYAVLENRLKPFPCGRLGHGAIEAALKARSAHKLTVEEIVSIQMHVEPRAQYLMGKSEPENGTQSMFSIAHGVAAALLNGQAGPAQFSDESVRDLNLRDLRRRVEVIPDPRCRAGEAKITVQTKSRGPLVSEVPIQKGYATNPLTDDDVKEKFLALAEPILGPTRAQRAVNLVYGLETLDDAGDLARLCA